MRSESRRGRGSHRCVPRLTTLILFPPFLPCIPFNLQLPFGLFREKRKKRARWKDKNKNQANKRRRAESERKRCLQNRTRKEDAKSEKRSGKRMRGNGNERTKDGVKRKKGHQGHSRPVGRVERQMRLHPTRLSLLLRGFGPRKIGGSGLGDFRCKCRNRNGGGCGRRGEACGFREEKGEKNGKEATTAAFSGFRFPPGLSGLEPIPLR